MQITVTTFYSFFAIAKDDVENVKNELEKFSEKVRGLIIMGTEGLNGTVSGSDNEINEFQNWLSDFLQKRNVREVQFKNSFCDFHPFRMLKVKVRPEIVSLGNTEIVPNTDMDDSHLTPEEWDELLHNPDSTCIDTRNWYETDVGKFKGAIVPSTQEFREFPEYLKNSNIPKDKPLMMYCTGGIRCEKAVIDAREQGYEKVFQLKGGILNYLAEKPNESFEGECFVFDNRVAVDQNLAPTKKFRLCPHCGQPANQPVSCLRCDTDALVCEPCLDQGKEFETCSKNCAYQFKLHPERKGQKQTQGFQAEIQMRKSSGGED